MAGLVWYGGDFYQTVAGGGNLGSVAKYSGGAWSASGNGEYFGSVFALTLFGSDLYAGGNFGGPGVVSNEIARLKISVP